jgi:hypothetical protein
MVIATSYRTNRFGKAMASQAAENSDSAGFWEGHGFSRAAQSQ